MENKELGVHIKYIKESIDRIETNLTPKVEKNEKDIAKMRTQTKMGFTIFTLLSTFIGWFFGKGH